MRVIFSDNHLLAAVKMGGMATQPDFEEEAKGWVKKHYQKPGAVFLEPIHRLDKPVSGIVLFARTSKALSRLHEMMRERRIVKTYRALVEERVKEDQGELRHWLVHDEFRARVDVKAGKESLLSYRVLERRENTTLVEITLHTGRYHQIRAQFSAIGHAIVGDKKYGSARTYLPDQIALMHVKMELVHPVGEPRTLTLTDDLLLVDSLFEGFA